VSREADLGSHHGLSLEGERDVAGRDEEAAIVYTSALCGTPLGAVLTHANLLANARSTVEALANVADDHVLALVPFAHLLGLTVTASAPLLAGGRVSTMERFDPMRAAALLADGGITEVVGVPAMFHRMLSAIEQGGFDVRGSRLRLAVSGGAALPVALQDRWAEMTGVELRQGYGLTEASPVCLFNRVDRPNVRGTLGRPLPQVEVAILPPSDYAREAVQRGVEDTRPLGDGEPGEIAVRGANVFRGYLDRAPDGLHRRGDWLCTGDRGVRNSDGTFTFLGVLKPMFTRNGFHVYPREVERVVREMPGVSRAEVWARAGPLGEHDVLLRVAGAVTEEEVQRWCESRLSAYKQPSAIQILGA
jgi:long-chain acyl-CoA synthetase